MHSLLLGDKVRVEAGTRVGHGAIISDAAKFITVDWVSRGRTLGVTSNINREEDGGWKNDKNQPCHVLLVKEFPG